MRGTSSYVATPGFEALDGAAVEANPAKSSDPMVCKWAAVIKKSAGLPHSAWGGFARALEACANVARAGEGLGNEGEFAKRVVPSLIKAFAESGSLAIRAPGGPGIAEGAYEVYWS